MENRLIENIIIALKKHDSPIVIIENNDGFLMRPDVLLELESANINASIGNQLTQRITFELNRNQTPLLLINREHRTYLEDIEQISARSEFFIAQFMEGYHIPSILDLPLSILDQLHTKKQLFKLSKKETIAKINEILYKDESINAFFDKQQLISEIENFESSKDKDWFSIINIFSKAINNTIGSDNLAFVLKELSRINILFQEFLVEKYNPLKNSSSIKKPQIVSKILDFIDFNFKNDKVALVVVDGMSFWQYNLISTNIPGDKKEDIIFSWIPSITQLSRQAIFRGDIPQDTYRQNPSNESKLWKAFWKSKKFSDFEIDYQYDSLNKNTLSNVKRLAVVFKDLDDYMHSSKDYKDLLNLTENWFIRSEFKKVIQDLLSNDFKVFITSDHGNIQAKGWRGLTGKEKLGSNKSGSRSERHIEYSEDWLKDEFLTNNPELSNSIVQEDQSLYFKDELSFSRRDQLVTHGGAHILEVLIPFIEVSNGK